MTNNFEYQSPFYDPNKRRVATVMTVIEQFTLTRSKCEHTSTLHQS